MAGAQRPRHLGADGGGHEPSGAPGDWVGLRAVPRRAAPPLAPVRRRAGARMGLGAVALVAALVSTAFATGREAEEAAPPTTLGEASAAPLEVAVCTRASLEERAGLVLVVGLPGVTTAEDPLVARLATAGVGGVMLRDENVLDEEQAVALVAGLRQRLGEDLLVAIDDEGGRVTSMRALGESIPSARRLGAQGPEAAEAAGVELGELAASIDVDWVLAPVTDVDDGPAAGVIGDRSFGGDLPTAAAGAAAFARGVQSTGVAVTAKHFPGHGGEGDPHLGGAVDGSTRAELEAVDLPAFDELIAAGAESVMVGHVTYPQIWGDELPASLDPDVYALLRERGFEGVAVTDALGMGAVHARWGFDTAPAMAVAAGADAVLVNQGDQVEVLHAGLVAAVQDGRLPEARLDEAVRRILALRDQPLDGIVCP